jgi:hypothetical protein
MALNTSGLDLKTANRGVIQTWCFCGGFAAAVHQAHALQQSQIMALQHNPVAEAFARGLRIHHHPGTAVIEAETPLWT